MPENISIRIDGEYVPAQLGPDHPRSRARRRQVHPHALLAGRHLTPVGACRLCIVEVSGVGRLLPACTTPVQDGMSVTTNSEKLTQLPPHRARVPLQRTQSPVRRLRLQQPLRTAGHGAEAGRHQRALSLRATPSSPVDLSHDRYVLDHNRCILCTRCVRVCAEVEGAHVWDVSSRGIRSMIVCDMNQPWGASFQLHQLRQVRAGVPHRRAGREGLRGGRDGEAGSQRDAPGAQAGRTVNEKGQARHRVAGRLLRLPHVAARYRRGHPRLAKRVDVVYGPLVDAQEFPKAVDVTLVEGAVSSQDDLEKIHDHPPAQQAGGRAGRLRRHRQRALHAQLASRAQNAGAHLRRRRAGEPGVPSVEACPPCSARPSRSTRW